MKEANWNIDNDAINAQSEEHDFTKKIQLQRQDARVDSSEKYTHDKQHLETKRFSYILNDQDQDDTHVRKNNHDDESIISENRDHDLITNSRVNDDIDALNTLDKSFSSKRVTIGQQQLSADGEVRERHDRPRHSQLSFQEHTSKRKCASNKAKSQQQVKGRQPQWRKDDKEVNLSFCGCGFLGIYHVGVASCFHQYAPQLSMHKISGSSAGALVAMAHICGDLQLAYCTTDILTIAIEARSHTLGSFHPSFDIQAQVRESLERGLPEDAYLKANGKLHVSLTRVEDGENVIISEFNSNEDLIQVLLCSCFIPFWSGFILPKYNGVAYIDGGFTNNLLVLDDKTVTVSPFSGEADICPQDDTLNLLQISLSNTSFSISPSNLYRLSHALLPPEPEILSDLCKQGFADGIRYLQRMNLISCTKCLEIRSSLLVTSGGEDIEEVFSTSANVNHCQDVDSYDSVSNNEINSFQQHVIIEQQEQETIKITENHSRRGSLVSMTSSHQLRHASKHGQQTTNSDGNNNLTPAVSLYNLLNGIDDEIIVDDDDDAYSTEDCNECVLIRQRALYDPLPKQFRDRIREASDKVNKSLSKWIYSHRPVNYLSYLMVPYYVPIDLTLAIIYRFWKKLPTIRREVVSDCVNQVLNFLIVILRRMQTRSTSAMLMGFGTSWEEDVIAYEKELIKQKRESTQVHHHHHHHHHHLTTSAPVVTNDPTTPIGKQTVSAAALNGRHQAQTNSTTCSPSISSINSNNNTSQSHYHHTPSKELHSLEDTFDSIVDVTSKQEARIFAYYFRDAKNRLQVTEIFDLERASNNTLGLEDTSSISSNKQTMDTIE